MTFFEEPRTMLDSRRLSPSIAAALLAVVSSPLFAQATVKEDGKWRSALGAAFSSSSGNTEATSLTLSGDLVRARTQDKWRIFGDMLFAKSEGTTSGNQVRLGTRYDWNFTPVWFTFAGANAERDPIAELSRRMSLSGGLGYRFLNLPDKTFSVFGGVQLTDDRYTAPRYIDGGTRDAYRYGSFLLGEESTHTFSESLTARQRFVVFPSMRNRGEFRAEFDGALQVAMTQSLSLNVGFTVRHESDPGPGIDTTDTLLTTGISVKFD